MVSHKNLGVQLQDFSSISSHKFNNNFSYFSLDGFLVTNYFNNFAAIWIKLFHNAYIFVPSLAVNWTHEHAHNSTVLVVIDGNNVITNFAIIMIIND